MMTIYGPQSYIGTTLVLGPIRLKIWLIINAKTDPTSVSIALVFNIIAS